MASSRNAGSAARSSSAMRNCTSRKRLFTLRRSSEIEPAATSRVTAAYPVMLLIMDSSCFRGRPTLHCPVKLRESADLRQS